MGLFKHNARTEPRTDAAVPGTRGGFLGWHEREYTMAKRPPFGQWLKITLPDLITMAIMGALALGIYQAPPAGTRLFPVTHDATSGEVVYPQFAYPYRDQYISPTVSTVLSALIPIFFILLFQIRVRSFWDVNNGIIGLLYSLIVAAVFQVFIKFLIGGLRPHFYDVCKPDISLAAAHNETGLEGTGYQGMFYSKAICSAENQNGIKNSLESFPSGHTTAAFAGFVYLYLYFNGKLKVFANYHPAMWKLILLYAPLLGAVLIAGSLTLDNSHNWYDILAGGIIGTVFAFSSYRMVFASVWDWRFNHIPLHRGTPFGYTDDADLMDATFTRRVNWGPVHSGETHHRGFGGVFGGKGKGHATGHTTAHGGVANGHSPATEHGFAHPRKVVGSGSNHRTSVSGDHMV